MNKDYRIGFKDGYNVAMDTFGRGQFDEDYYAEESKQRAEDFFAMGIRKKAKRKIKQTPKQKLLTKMSKKKWDKYKKGKGKKTYVEIRAEVSRSQAFKKAAKRL
jgi:hypothetical protein